jgi:hypothetical protein
MGGQSRKCSCLDGTSGCTLKSGRRQAQAKFILSLVSQAIPIPLSSQKCLGQLQSLLARENLRPQPPAREISDAQPKRRKYKPACNLY